MKKILLVEDDDSLNRGVSFKLRKEGMEVFSCKNLKESREVFSKENIDLIILDVGLPDGNGFEFCSEIRKSSDVLIIFLTACDEEVDIVMGLDMGGDDYLTKPFSFMVLISRINALLRRTIDKRMSEKITLGNVVFYSNDLKVFKNDKEITLSKTELKLLRYLMINNNQIVTKEQLLNELWDIEGDFIDPNTIAVNIRRLREKIEDNPSEPRYIKTVRGVGYIWMNKK